MTIKHKVDLDAYRKAPRLLGNQMEHALGPNGGLRPILAEVTKDPRLRLDIRDRRFNVYYSGGNLLLVDGRVSPWALSFDERYFKDNPIKPPDLPQSFTADAAHTWVKAFPKLIAGMDAWWTSHPRGERTHCQAMATTNSGMAGPPPSDYLVLDLEYQWAQRRFDMVAAKRRPTENDPTGWAEPDFVFVEVKSAYGACSGKSGLGDHARDYRDIITARRGRCVHDIKMEYENLWAQKARLGLLHESLEFTRFSPAVPELLLVFVDLDRNAHSLLPPMGEVRAVADALGDRACIRYMSMNAQNFVMRADAAVSARDAPAT